jgi:hypothetical protein
MLENQIEMTDSPNWALERVNGILERLKIPAEILPELDFITGSLISNLVALEQISLSPFANSLYSDGWNYIDGIISILTGIALIVDQDDYRETQAKIKGAIKILSGIQLIICTSVGGTGSPAATSAFAISTCTDLITTLIDHFNTVKEASFEGWLEERAKELAFLERKLEEAKLANNGTRQNKLQSRIDLLLPQIESRCRVHFYYEKPVAEENSKEYEENEAFVRNIFPGYGKYRNEEKFDYHKKPTSPDIARDKLIQAINDRRLEISKRNLIVGGLSFIGMSLVAAATIFALSTFPPLMIATIIITSLVSCYYLIKNFEKIHNTGKILYCQFFQPDTKQNPSGEMWELNKQLASTLHFS